MYTCTTDFLCCTAETNIVKKLYFNKNKGGRWEGTDDFNVFWTPHTEGTQASQC